MTPAQLKKSCDRCVNYVREYIKENRQDAIAKSGMSKQYASHIANNRREIGYEYAIELATKFKIEI